MPTIWHHMCTNQMMIAKFTVSFFFLLHIMMFHLLNSLSLLIGCIFITLTVVESIIVWILHWISVIIIFWPFLEVQSFVMCFFMYIITGGGHSMGKGGPCKPWTVHEWLGWSFFSCKFQVLFIPVPMNSLAFCFYFYF